MKRFACVLLAALMIFSAFPAASFAESLEADPVTSADIERVMKSIAEATGKIDELKDEFESGQQIASAFSEFMKVAGYAGTALGVINGSVTFLKLIGVMEDPIKGGIANILDEIKVIDEKMAEMDSKLDNISTAMTTMQASSEFNNRGLKAMNLRSSWTGFQYNYMESGMDQLMNQYNGMLLNGIKAWWRNESESARKAGGMDNTQIILIYLKDKDGEEQPYSFAGEGIPDDIPEDAPYVILKADCIPDTLDSFNVNNYQKTLADAIKTRILAALDAENYDAFESRNMPMFTPEGKDQIDEDEIAKIAADAVNVLLYRIGCAEVNRDAAFAIAVDSHFTNYCSHLMAAGEGIDAMLNSFYLTHAFEYEVSKDLQDFLNRMILKTGTYGAFVTNVLGMSDTTTDSAKLLAMKRFCDTEDRLNEALKNCVTGNGRYSYLTNTELRYAELSISNGVSASTEHIYTDKEVYDGFKTTGFKFMVRGLTPSDYTQLGDVNSMLLFYTLKNNGVTNLHKYLSENNTGTYGVTDYENIVTSWGKAQTLPLDGSVKLNAYNILGNDYSGISTTTLKPEKKDYPDNASPDYIVHREKVCGTVYDTASGNLTSNKVLLATALYGQSHWYWFKDEAALFAGPADYRYNYSEVETYIRDRFYYTEEMIAVSDFNTIVSLVPKASLTEAEGYDPLASLAELNKELEEDWPHLEWPPEIDVPEAEKPNDLDLVDPAYWGLTEGCDDERLQQMCLELIDARLEEAGFEKDALSEKEKAKLAREMMDFYRKGRKEMTKNSALDPEDPLGIGQNNDAAAELAKDILPDYLLDENGNISEDVKYLFIKERYELFPDIEFTSENGRPKAKLSCGYQTVPVLVVGEITPQEFQVLTYDINDGFYTVLHKKSPETGWNAAPAAFFAAAAFCTAVSAAYVFAVRRKESL